MKSSYEIGSYSKTNATYRQFDDTGVREAEWTSAVVLYPNPAYSMLHIETGNTDKIPEVKIYSIQGVLLMNTKGNQIDISSLARGIYIAEVNGICRKIIKQ
jgi:hypothetical protein